MELFSFVVGAITGGVMFAVGFMGALRLDQRGRQRSKKWRS